MHTLNSSVLVSLTLGRLRFGAKCFHYLEAGCIYKSHPPNYRSESFFAKKNRTGKQVSTLKGENWWNASGAIIWCQVRVQDILTVGCHRSTWDKKLFTGFTGFSNVPSSEKFTWIISHNSHLNSSNPSRRLTQCYLSNAANAKRFDGFDDAMASHGYFLNGIYIKKKKSDKGEQESLNPLQHGATINVYVVSLKNPQPKSHPSSLKPPEFWT